MIYWLCSAITIGASVAATFISDVRWAALALWVVGLGAGGIYLSLGAEFLAIVQWIVSTFVALSFIFYSVMFGEYGVSDRRPLSRKVIAALMPVAAGFGLAAVVLLGTGHIAVPPQPAAPGGQDLSALGRKLAGGNILALEILALTLFLVVVGAGVITRPESDDGDEGGKT